MTQPNLAVSDPRSADREPPTDNGGFLREMIVTDLNWTTLQVGMLCMMATACSAQAGRFSMHAMRHVAYDDTCVVRLALRYGESAALPGAVVRKLDKFYADLSLVQTQIAPLVAAATLSRSQVEQLSRALPALRKIALSAIEALREVEPVARAHLNATYVQDSETIRQFLSRAARGEVAEIDRFGVVTPPALKQRRQSPRAAVRKRCRIAFGGGEVDAEIFDISRSGLGVICAVSLAEKQAVEVIVDGRRLAAVVARCVGERLGLRLKEPLGVNDPLYRAR